VPRRHWTPAQRGEALARFATSGLTQAEFCRRAGLSAATFSSWRRKTARGQNSANPAVGGFARVQVAPASPMTTTNAAIVVQVDDGLRVTVPVGTDAVWLGQVLSGLRPR
jgi:transposase-like protein